MMALTPGAAAASYNAMFMLPEPYTMDTSGSASMVSMSNSEFTVWRLARLRNQ